MKSLTSESIAYLWQSACKQKKKEKKSGKYTTECFSFTSACPQVQCHPSVMLSCFEGECALLPPHLSCN